MDRSGGLLRFVLAPAGLLLLSACAASAPRTTAAAAAAGAAADPSGAEWRTLSSSDLVAQNAPQDAPPIPATELEASPEHDAEALAKKLNNPVAALISVPFQFNYDSDIGPAEHGHKLAVNVQPVIPFALNDEWNLISRTILPLVHQEEIRSGAGTQNGAGDITQSLFFSPARPTESGIVWGAGPVFLIPTASDNLLGSEKWGVGLTGVILKQDGPWTIGALANHIWSVAGDDDREDISSTFVQPFLAYTTKEAWTYTLNTESTFDWKTDDWSVPVNAVVSKVTRIGGQLVSIGGGLRYWTDPAPDGPEGLGLRFVVTLLYPRK